MGFINNLIKKIFGINSKKQNNTTNMSSTKHASKTSNLDKGFHPEILFLVNRPYAEYVDFEEIKTKK